MTDYRVPLLINGTNHFTETTFDIISPHTNKLCWKAFSVSYAEVITAIKSAQAAFPIWSKTKPHVLNVASNLESHTEEYARYISTEMGADLNTSIVIVLPLAIQMLRDIASRISSICGSIAVAESEGQSAMVFKEPYGVILGIVPWYVRNNLSIYKSLFKNLVENEDRNPADIRHTFRNAPFVFGVRAAATAIATGNTTVLKASELSP